MSLSNDERLILIQESYRDPVFFNKTFLPHLFPKDPPWVHRGILSILTGRTAFLQKYGEVSKLVRNFSPLFRVFRFEDGSELNIEEDRVEIDQRAVDSGLHIQINRNKYVLVIMPRGSSKTTLAGVGVPVRETVFQDLPFFCYVSEAGAHAKMQLDNVKRELESNERLIEVFGEMKPELKDPERWAADMFETCTGVAMVARGRGGQVRGLNHRGERPHKIICDDLEDKESVETEHQRKKTRTWAYGDLLPALSKIKGEGTMTVLGTLLHPEALLTFFEKDPQFTSVKFGAHDKDGELIWDSWMNERDLETRKESAALAGELETYYLEYHSEATSTETNPFRKYQFVYGDSEIIGAPAIYCDPAISQKARADDAVILVGGMGKNGKIIILDDWGKRGATPRDLIDEYFRLSILHKCWNHGIESVAYQAALVHLLREEMFRKKHYFEVTPVLHTASEKKVSRIMGIIYPRFASGYILLRRPIPKLEAQLYDFNPMKKEQKDDWPDCLAGLISLLDPYAAAAVGDGKPLEDDVYEPLENWRWA